MGYSPMLLRSRIRFGAGMKEQYVGDINDYRKYAMLRTLTADGENRIGVCWMLTPSDGSSDGSKRAYLQQPAKHRRHDPELFDILARVRDDPDRRRLRHIEESGAIPGARYFNHPLSDNASERRAYMEACRGEFGDTDLVFFDPDNGLEVKKPKIGHKGSSKFLFEEELKAVYENGQSVLVYQHFPFIPREVFTASCVERLRRLAPDATVGTYQTAHVVFLLLLNPRSPARLADAAQEAATRWAPKFIAGTLYEPAQPEAPQGKAETPVAAEALSPRQPVQIEPEAPHPADSSHDDERPQRPSLLRRIIARLR